ncbi:hypothetical protein [Corynebacterium suranareeae]|uniref:hypothetical protein n=1 Tax=Corynebacterium suranareeae TaxID=2506452 RepID=UPI000BBAE099|nr:hypothetical protein [Corynebacterium suranareeae]
MSTILLTGVVIIGGIFGLTQGEDTKPSESQPQVSSEASSVSTSAAAQAIEDSPFAEFIENSTGSQITFVSLKDDFRTGTSTERFARPALSLGKLYIAEYVLERGTENEKALALEMIRSSSDVSAEILYDTYPDSIEAIADEFGLLSTRGDEHWGYSVTSTYDLVKFLSTLIIEQPESPILEAMRNANEFAVDGYPQDWGTAVLPGAEGSKWGWSDDRLLHSSITFGEDYVVAAAVTGTKEDLTQLVENQLSEVISRNN